MSNPLVSVVIPVFNGARYIAEALNSVLVQTLKEFEIVVVNDGSTDSTAHIISGYSDSRIRLVDHNNNYGLAEARNTGINNSRGKYIALLDGDDISDPTRLAEQVKEMERDQRIVFLGSWATIIDDKSRPTGKLWKMESRDEDLRVLLLFRNRFIVSSTMFRRERVPGGLFQNVPMAEDYSFAVAMSRIGRIGNLPKPLIRYRRHATSLTTSKQALMTECVEKILLQQLEDFGIRPSERELKIHQHVGRLLLQSSVSLLGECENWLCKLSNHNDVVQRFDSHVFREIVSKEWFELCKHGSPAGLAAWRGYWRSNLSKAWLPSMWQRLKFLVKCLFKHRREGGDVPKVQAPQES